MGLLRVTDAGPELRKLTEDESSLAFLIETRLTTIRVKDLAEEALRAIGGEKLDLARDGHS
jgi:hypothetical protein